MPRSAHEPTQSSCVGECCAGRVGGEQSVCERCAERGLKAEVLARGSHGTTGGAVTVSWTTCVWWCESAGVLGLTRAKSLRGEVCSRGLLGNANAKHGILMGLRRQGSSLVHCKLYTGCPRARHLDSVLTYFRLRSDPRLN